MNMLTKLKALSLGIISMFIIGVILSLPAKQAQAATEGPPPYTATTGTLIVIKTVINDNSGLAVAADFPLWLNHAPGGVTSTDMFMGDSSGTTLEIAVGAYNIIENPTLNYKNSFSADCSGTMNPGEVKTCTVTNDDVSDGNELPTATTGTLTIIKTVINDQDGTSVASDFSIDVGLVTSSTSATTTIMGNTEGTVMVLEAGNFNVEEAYVSNYGATYTGDCNGYLAVGESKICTITNNDISYSDHGTLIVVKKVINNYGLAYASEDFTMHVTHYTYRSNVEDSMVRIAMIKINTTTTTSFPGEASGTTLLIGSGDYTVTEDEDGNFDAKYSEDCKGTMLVGATRTCTITNTAKLAHGGGRIITKEETTNEENPGNDETANEGGSDATSSTSTQPVPRVLGVEDVAVLCMLTEEESYFISSDVNVVLNHVGKVRDMELEQHYADLLTPGIIPTDINADQKSAIVNFVTYGTLSNQRLGQGERAGVVNSYHAVYGRLPLTDCDWQNAIKIANTTLPLDLAPEREAKMLDTFKTIYGRNADLNNARDNVAVKVMSYGIRPQIRDISAEWDAAMVFEQIYGKRPETATEWDANRAIAYSGIAHSLLSRDLTNAASRIMSIAVKNEPIR